MATNSRMPLENIKTDFINKFINSNLKENLVLNGFLAPFNLFLIKNIVKSGKKTIYITPNEQTALKIQKDLSNLLNIESFIFPSQEISFYSELEKNYYIYTEQINLIQSQANIILMPVKSLFEKFADINFYKKNIIEFKKNDTVDYSKITKKLIRLG